MNNKYKILIIEDEVSIAELEKDYIHGITFSGGDPLHIANAYDVTEFAKEIRKK